MTDIREVLDEIEKGCEGVTPGPWKAEQTGNEWHVFMLSTDETICVIEEWSREIDGADAAHLARLDPQTMLAIIELARKGLAADAGEGWQPIETAPKNRKVLVAYLNGIGNWRIVTACYHTKLPWSDDHWRDDDDESEYSPEGWYEESDSSETIYPTAHSPTHWRPLPASPHPGASMSTPTDAGLEALARFVPSYESWMDRHADDVALSFYRPATFGDLRAAWKAIAALVPAEPAPSPASEPVAVNPAAAAFGRALSDLPALALAAGCFVAIKVTELKK